MTRRRAMVVSALASVVVVASLLQTNAAQSLLRVTGVVSAQAPFLELFFADPTGHPPQVSPGQRLPVSFVLRSHGATYDVAWRVETLEGPVTQTQARGSTIVPDGTSRALTVVVTVACAASVGSRTQVRVSTDVPAESILFWVTCLTSSS